MERVAIHRLLHSLPLTLTPAPAPAPTPPYHSLIPFRSSSIRRRIIFSTTVSKMSTATASHFTFGPYKIDSSEVFYISELSYAFVNLRPVLPDVLVCPLRKVKRFVDLTPHEITDLWHTAHKIAPPLERYHNGTSLTFTIQDGPEAGQTVPHVHVHVIPRKVGDFENNDEIYDAIDEKEKELKKKLDLDKDRKDRSREEMAREAAEYRKFFS